MIATLQHEDIYLKLTAPKSSLTKPWPPPQIMATATTQYPSPSFPSPIKDLIALFYTLIESHADNVGLRLADEVFTANGIMQSGTQRFSGREGI
jgi:hypothetical protein